MTKEFSMFELFQPFDETAQLAIQSGWHNPLIDTLMKIISVANDHGEIWFAAIIALLLFKKTRKCGIALFFSLGIIFLLNQFVLKLLFERPRPYNVLTQFEPLLPRLKSFSFPSGHSITSFGSAVSLTISETHYNIWDPEKNFVKRHRLGIIALITAALIAFSRVYLFMHWPTDVIGGAIIAGLLATLITLGFFKLEAIVIARRSAKGENPQ